MFKARRTFWSAPHFLVAPFVLITALSVYGCQTVQIRNHNLVRDRAEKLRPLSKWRTAWCEVETELTHPAVARYQQMFPKEKARTQESLKFTWRASESACEIKGGEESPLMKNQKGFVESAMCLLMQVHWVNSPFDEMDVRTQDLESRQVGEGDGAVEAVHVRTAGAGADYGMFVLSPDFKVETRTKSRGVLRATYAENAGEWLPSRLEQSGTNTQFVVEDIEYSDEKIGSRRMLKSFWISVGTDRALRHSKVSFYNCRAD